MSSFVVGGCTYPANYFNIAYPLMSFPSGGIFIKSATYYQDYQDLLNERLAEERRKREAANKEYNDKKARDFWSRYFGGFFGQEEDIPEEQKAVDYPYSVFGLKKSASADDMKKAYRKSVMKAHPDKGGTAELFRKVRQAWDFFRNM
tara:strand:- start:696 stop:1136 length:441 start_codon:yes stop_codon:yes gene_type:complete